MNMLKTLILTSPTSYYMDAFHIYRAVFRCKICNKMATTTTSIFILAVMIGVSFVMEDLD